MADCWHRGSGPVPVGASWIQLGDPCKPVAFASTQASLRAVTPLNPPKNINRSFASSYAWPLPSWLSRAPGPWPPGESLVQLRIVGGFDVIAGGWSVTMNPPLSVATSAPVVTVTFRAPTAAEI